MSSLLTINLISFFAGFIAASIFWFLISRLFRWLPKAIANYQKQKEENAQKKSAGFRARICDAVYRQVQSCHIGSAIFSLDEIIIEPRIIAPPIPIQPGQTITSEELSGKLIPYTPDYPELSSYFCVSTLSLAEAASGGCNIVLIGPPGIGKSTALAHFASIIARKDPAAGKFIDYVPLFLHISELAPNLNDKKPAIDRVIYAVQQKMPASIRKDFPAYIHRRIAAGKVILLLDGLDSLPATEFDQAAGWIEEILQYYPNIQCIVAAGANYLDGLIKLSFEPLALQPWDLDKRLQFTQNWGAKWTKLFLPLLKQAQPDTSPLLISNWIRDIDPTSTPLEITLTVWQIFAGEYNPDISYSPIQSYLEKLLGSSDTVEALAFLAAHMVKDQLSAIPIGSAEKIINTAIQEIKRTLSTGSDGIIENLEKNKKRTTKLTSASKILDLAIEAGILISNSNGHLTFAYPIIFSFLAGKISQDLIETNIIGRMRWSVEEKAFWYALRNNRLTNPQALLVESDAPLLRNLQIAAKWSTQVTPDIPWFSIFMREIIKTVEDETLPFGLRLRVLSSAVIGAKTPLSTLLRKWISSNSPTMRQLGVLGCGLSQDEKLIKDMLGLLADSISEVRYAACLAITAFQTETAQKILAELFLQGEEPIRQIVAETFASGRYQGFDILREAATHEDILTRRAAVLGLSLIKEAWSQAILEKVSVEDSQWVVRNAAGQGLELINKPSEHIPTPQVKPSEAEWLIKYAAKTGIGLKKGEFPIGLLQEVFRYGDPEEQSAALRYLSRATDEKLFALLYPQLVGDHRDMRDQVYYALWLQGVSGIKLPTPKAFGLG